MKCPECKSKCVKESLPLAEITPGSKRRPKYVWYWYCESCKRIKKRCNK
jgi:hypothetical protein